MEAVQFVEVKNFEISFETLARRVRLELSPDLEGELKRLYDAALEVARPRGVWRLCFIDAHLDDGFVSEGERFSSRVAAQNLEGLNRIFPYTAGCGPELDSTLLQAAETGGDFLQRYWLDEIKALAMGAAVRAVREDIKEQYKPGALQSMNPGSGNEDVWPIEEQVPLFRLIGEEGREWAGIKLTDSLLMQPNKSVSGFFFAGTANYESCAYCDRPDCPDRRVPNPHGI